MAMAANKDQVSGNPLDHVQIVNKKAASSDYKCNYCDKVFTGSKTRCYIHLTGDGKGIAKCLKCHG